MLLEDLKVYSLAMEIGESIWKVSNQWGHFEKFTIGTQLVKASDSIAANISEGFGRYHYKDSKNFNYYARGSLYETKTWIQKAFNRNLVSQGEYQKLMQQIDQLTKMLNSYIKSIGQNVNEPEEFYETTPKTEKFD